MEEKLGPAAKPKRPPPRITKPEDWRVNLRRKTVTHACGAVFLIRPSMVWRDRRPEAVPCEPDELPVAWDKKFFRVLDEALQAYLQALADRQGANPTQT